MQRKYGINLEIRNKREKKKLGNENVLSTSKFEVNEPQIAVLSSARINRSSMKLELKKKKKKIPSRCGDSLATNPLSC